MERGLDSCGFCGMKGFDAAQLRSLTLEQTLRAWMEFEAHGRKVGKLDQVVRLLCLSDLFYILVRTCLRQDMANEFAYARCREVENSPDGHLDLWAREHWKSSIITFGMTIKDILNDPNVTIGIFSHTRPIAKAFLRQIMREFEANRTLQAAFPDVLWGAQLKDAPKWSEDDGIIVRRKSNPNEATIEAWGLVDGQPTSKHYKVLVYDDIVVKESVTNPEMIAKTMTSLEQSYNLGVTPGGVRRFVGTRWHFNDAYRTIMDRGTAKAREYPGREGGTEEGKSVFWSEETHQKKRRDMGPYTYAAQILLNPKADAAMGFKREWLRYYTNISPRGMNGYILVDSANTKRKESDFSACWVVLLGVDGNFYAIPEFRDRLNLTERITRVMEIHRRWKHDGVKWQQVRWERYGMMADIEALKLEQEKQNYRFDITEVAGQSSKDDRIRRLIPIFEQGHVYLPKSRHVTDWEKNTVDLVRSFVEEEFYPFPTCLHKDMLDSLSRVMEPDFKLVFPKEEKAEYIPPRAEPARPQVSWMGG